VAWSKAFALDRDHDTSVVTPAKAGVQRGEALQLPWIPACAGMTIQDCPWR